MDVGNLMNGLGGGLGTIANWGTQLVDSGKSQVNTVGMNYNNAGLNNISDLSNFQANTFDTGDIVAPNKAAQAGNVFTSMGEGALAGSSINVPWGTIAGAAAGLAKGTAQAFIQNDTYHNDIARANRFNNNSRKTAVKLAGQASNNIVNNSYNSMRFNNEFAEGGDLSYGMPNIDIINSGGTHEGNPNMGVAYGVDNQGTPNKVEEGEVVVELSSGEKVVISDRVISSREDGLKNNVPSFDGKISCAQMAKKIIESFKDRKDPYSKKTMNALLERIYNTQEYTKIRQEAESQGMTAEEYIQMQQEQEAYAQQQMLAQQQAQQAQSQDQMQDQGYDEDMMYSNGSDQQAAMIQQLAQEYGVSPEEIMQMIAQQQGGEVPQEEIPQENMNAYGGNLYATGGRKKKFGYNHYKKAYPWIDKEGFKALRDGLFVGESGDDYFYGSNLDGYINDIKNKALDLDDPEHLSPKNRAQLINELSTPRLIAPEDPESDIYGGLLPVFPNPIEKEAIKHNYLDKSRKEFKKEINNPVYGYTKIARKNLLDFYDKNNPSVLAEALNTASSIGGFIPGPGDAIDVANAVVQANQGNWVDAGLSALSAVPLAGIFGNLAKLFKSGQKLRRAKAYIDGAYTYAKTGNFDTRQLNETYGLTGRYKLSSDFLDIIEDEKKLAKKINVDGLPHKTEDYLQVLKEIKPDKDVFTRFKTTNINGKPVIIIKNADNSIEVKEKGSRIIFTKSKNNKDYKVQQKFFNDSGTEVVTTITGPKADEYKKAYETFLSSKYSNNTTTTLTKDGEIIRVSKTDNSTTTEYFNGVTSTYYNKTGDTKIEYPNGDKVISKKQKENGVHTGKYEINVTDTEGNASVYYADKEPTTDDLRGYVKTHNTTYTPTPTGKPAESMAEPSNNNAANTNAAESTPTSAKPTTESTGAKPTETPKPTESVTTESVTDNTKPTESTTESTTTKPTESATSTNNKMYKGQKILRENKYYIQTEDGKYHPTKRMYLRTFSTPGSTSVFNHSSGKAWRAAKNNNKPHSKELYNEYFNDIYNSENAPAHPTFHPIFNKQNRQNYNEVFPDYWKLRLTGLAGVTTEGALLGLGAYGVINKLAKLNRFESEIEKSEEVDRSNVSLVEAQYKENADLYRKAIINLNKALSTGYETEVIKQAILANSAYKQASKYAERIRQEGNTIAPDNLFFNIDQEPVEFNEKAANVNNITNNSIKKYWEGNELDPDASFWNKDTFNKFINENPDLLDIRAMGGSLSNSLPEYDQYLLRRSRINSDPNLFASGGPATFNFPKNFLGPMNQFGDLNILTSNNNFNTHQSSMSMDNNNNTNRSERITSQDRKLLSEPILSNPQNPLTRDQRKAARRERWANQKDGFQKATNMFAQTNPLQYTSLFDSINSRLFPDKPDYTYADNLKGMYNPIPYLPTTNKLNKQSESSLYHNIGLGNAAYASTLNDINNYGYNNNISRALKLASTDKHHSSLGDTLMNNYNTILNNNNELISNINSVNLANAERAANTHAFNNQNMLNTIGLGYQQADAERTALREAQGKSKAAMIKDLSTLGQNISKTANINSNPSLAYDVWNNYKNMGQEDRDGLIKLLNAIQPMYTDIASGKTN